MEWSGPKTFYYDHINKVWPHGPILNKQRRNHAVGIVTDEATHQKLVVVTGGDGVYSQSDFGSNRGLIDLLNSTEVLLAGNWTLGKGSILFLWTPSYEMTESGYI